MPQSGENREGGRPYDHGLLQDEALGEAEAFLAQETAPSLGGALRDRFQVTAHHALPGHGEDETAGMGDRDLPPALAALDLRLAVRPVAQHFGTGRGTGSLQETGEDGRAVRPRGPPRTRLTRITAAGRPK